MLAQSLDQARASIAAVAAKAQVCDVPMQGAAATDFVRWRRWGQGAPLVLLHGGHGSWLHWIKNIEALAQSRSVWVPDMPCYGDSSLAVGDPQQEMAYCQAIVAALGDSMAAVLPQGPIDLVGFSFGGLIAGLLSVQQPRVRRLALIGPAGHGGPRQPRQEPIRWRGLQDQALAAAMRHNLAASMLYQPASIDALAVEVHRHSSQHARCRSRSASRSSALMEALESLHLPLLLMWGEHDVTAIAPAAAAALAQGRTERQHLILPGVGHWLQYEAPEQTNALLQQWLQRAD